MQIHGGPGGRAQVVKLEKKLESVGPCLSIALSEDPSSTNVWTIEVFVQYETLGNSKLGEFTTTPPAAGDPPNRIVAFANCPGAKGWSVQARTDDPSALADLNLDTSLYSAGHFGVHVNKPIPDVEEECDSVCFGPVPGELDAWARLNALMQLWAYKKKIIFKPGTYPVRSPGHPPSGTTLIMGSGVHVESHLPVSGVQISSIFYAAPTIVPGGTTLAANVVQGAETISTNASIPKDTWIRLQEVAHPIQLAFYQVTNVAGVGPFTLTLDRSVLLPFVTNDTVDILDGPPPSDIVIEANHATFTGTGDRVSEMIGALRCHVRGVRYIPDGGTTTDAGISLDTGSRESTIEDCIVDGGGATGFGLLLETAERCEMISCQSFNCSVTAILATDCFYSQLLESNGWNSARGLVFGTDGGGIGNQDCQVTNCSFIGNNIIGLSLGIGKGNEFNGCSGDYTITGEGCNVGNGEIADNYKFTDCSFKGNATAGMRIDSNAINTEATNLSVLDNVGSGLNIFGDIKVDGFRGTGVFPVAGGAGTYSFSIDKFFVDAAVGTVAFSSSSTGEMNLSNGICKAGNGSNCFSQQAAGVMILRDVKATVGGGGFGVVQAVAGGTYRAYGKVDLDGCTNPSLFNPGTFQNRGQVTADGTGNPQNIAWPDIKTGEIVKLTLHTSAGTPSGIFSSVTVPATGFTFQTAALNTSVYDYEI